MDLQQTTSTVSRLFFAVSFLLLGLAVLEKMANLFGYTILRETYGPARLLEFAVILLVFVVALLLRQIREELRRGKA
jgi:hypothetical protein